MAGRRILASEGLESVPEYKARLEAAVRAHDRAINGRTDEMEEEVRRFNEIGPVPEALAVAGDAEQDVRQRRVAALALTNTLLAMNHACRIFSPKEKLRRHEYSRDRQMRKRAL